MILGNIRVHFRNEVANIFDVRYFLQDVIFPKVDAQMKYQQSTHTDKTTAKVLKDLEQTSTSLANVDIGKDP